MLYTRPRHVRGYVDKRATFDDYVLLLLLYACILLLLLYGLCRPVDVVFGGEDRRSL